MKAIHNNRKVLVLIITSITLIFLAVIFRQQLFPQNDSTISTQTENTESLPNRLALSDIKTDFSKTNVDIDKVLSGGVGKDGIPALTNPEFVSMEESTVSDDTQVMVVEHNNEVKVYPYSIMVWHEIVNDVVGGKPLAVTFCPLCGSAIVFNREIDGKVVDFGVSGLLYESNVVMYTREEPESLFSQSLGEAIIGERIGEKLEHFPIQLMSYADAKEQFVTALVLSENTGFSRDYRTNPYGNYDESEELYFQVSNKDNRFPGKKLFFIVPLGGVSVAVNLDKEDGEYPVPNSDVVVVFEKGQVTAKWGDAVIPGYYEMWFSWATHNQENGIVL